MAICATGTARTDPASPFHGAQARDRTVRVLRWTFRRQEDAVVCELGLNATDTAYELRVDPACNPAVRIVANGGEMLSQQDLGFLQLVLVDQSPRLGDFRRWRLRLVLWNGKLPLVLLHGFTQPAGGCLVPRGGRNGRPGLLRGFPQFAFQTRFASLGFRRIR